MKPRQAVNSCKYYGLVQSGWMYRYNYFKYRTITARYDIKLFSKEGNIFTIYKSKLNLEQFNIPVIENLLNREGKYYNKPNYGSVVIEIYDTVNNYVFRFNHVTIRKAIPEPAIWIASTSTTNYLTHTLIINENN